MRNIKSYKRKLSRLCYFRRINREEGNLIIDSFVSESSVYPRDKKDIFEKYKAMVKKDYKVNLFKLVPLVISIVSTAFALCSILENYLLYDICVLDYKYDRFVDFLSLSVFILCPFSLIYNAIGVVIGKIKIRNYRYNWLAFIVQLFTSFSAIMYALYLLAKGLESF